MSSSISEMTIHVSVDKGKEWMIFPLEPDKDQIIRIIPDVRKIYESKKEGNIRYHFKGKDTSGNIKINDNEGKYYNRLA